MSLLLRLSIIDYRLSHDITSIDYIAFRTLFVLIELKKKINTKDREKLLYLIDWYLFPTNTTKVSMTNKK